MSDKIEELLELQMIEDALNEEGREAAIMDLAESLYLYDVGEGWDEQTDEVRGSWIKRAEREWRVS